LVVAIFDEATLTTSTAGDGATVGLHVGVPNEPALAATATRVRPALCLKVGIFDEAALTALCEDRGDGRNN
jgi:hypothetical protein